MTAVHPQVNDRCLEALAHGSHNTLTSLDLSNCANITEDALGWISGALGVAPTPCRKLLTLNVTNCPGVRDKGLVWLGKACTQLRYLNVSRCTQLTSVGVIGLAPCAELRVVNFAHNDLVDDHGVVSVARHCPLLRSLNVK